MSAPDALVTALAGSYRIERELGAGGMATVYLAEDLRHGRQVAIKVVREEVAASVGGSRFLREIEIAARLQHPHILTLLDSGDVGGILYYVMPYVAGESLRQRLDREGELPIPDALRLITQVVDALAGAHAQGVVHRDIKADNILLAGRNAMVMDFGIAKAVRDAAMPAATSTTMTQVGMAMGTPAYMAPEQAAADPAMDHRVDLYAVGVLAYEMLTGSLPFAAESPQAMLAAHLTEAPYPVTMRRPTVPAALGAAVMRCLEKRPADRWQRAEDLLAALELIASTASGGVPAQGGGRAPRTRRLVGGLAGLALLGMGAWWVLTPKAPEGFLVGRSEQFTSLPELEIHPALSPDGKLMAFAAGTAHSMRIYVRPVAGGRTVALSDDTTAVEFLPSWSPDATWLAFVHDGALTVAPALGGDARTIVAAISGRPLTSVTWSPDGQRLAFTRGDSLFTVPLTAGAPTFLGTERDLHSCEWAPTDAWIACASRNSTGQIPTGTFGNRAPSQIVSFPAAGGSPVVITSGDGGNLSPRWAPDGGTLYFLSDRSGPRDVFAVRIGRDGAPRGEAVRLTTGLDALAISMARDAGRLAYNVYSARANIWRLPIPTAGSVSAYRAEPLTMGSQVVEAMAVSVDGEWVVFDSNLKGNSDIYRIPARGGAVDQLTATAWDEFAPSLSPDNRQVVFHSFRNGTRDIEVVNVTGGGPPMRITDTDEGSESYPRWSPDGSRIAFQDQGRSRAVAVVTRSAEGRFGAPMQVGNGLTPAWNRSGDRLFFRAVGDLTSSDEALARGAQILEVPAAGGTPVVRMADPALSRWRQLCVSADDRTIYTKGFDAAGRASIVGLPIAGGPARVLVTFEDAARPSTRGDFACGPRDFFFTIDELQSDLYVAEIGRGR